MMIVNTIPTPEKIAPATKYGGKIVVCQPGVERHREVQGHDGVHREHERRGERGEEQVRAVKWRHSRSEFRQPSDSAP